MKMKRHNIVLYILLTTSMVLAIFLLIRGYKMKNRLNDLHEAARQAEEKSDFYWRILAIDSLLVGENLKDARQAYEKLFSEARDFNEIRQAIERRLFTTRALQDMQEKLTAFPQKELYGSVLDKARQIDSLTTKLENVEDFHRDQLDSLSFALEKANVRTESLTRQITGQLKRDYLKFTDNKGTEIHYVGEMESKQANGWGVALYSTGSRYEGQWKDNQRHGEGVFYWPDGEYYQGNFKLDQRHGQGKYFWPNGDMFSGKWQNDKRNGPGTFYDKDGSVVASGTWKENELTVKKK